MEIPKDENKILRNIPQNDFRQFFADPLAKSYKTHLDSLYISFNEQLKLNGIPNQSQLMLIISQYGPYSTRIDKHMRQNKELKDQNQRNLLGQCFVKTFLPKVNWKDDKGRSLLDLIEQFQKKKLENKNPKNLQNLNGSQQSMLLEQYDSIDNNESFDSMKQSNQQNVSAEEFVSMIRDNSNSNENFVDIPFNVSNIKGNSSKAETTQIEEIMKEKFDKQYLNRKTKQIRKNNKQLMKQRVKLEVDVQKQEKKDDFKSQKGQKNPIPAIMQTPFEPDPNDNNPPPSQMRPPHQYIDSSNDNNFVNIPNSIAPTQKSISNVRGSSIFQSFINYPSLPENDAPVPKQDPEEKKPDQSFKNQFSFQKFSQNPSNPCPSSMHPQQPSQQFGYQNMYVPSFASPPMVNPYYPNYMNPMPLRYVQQPFIEPSKNYKNFPQNYSLAYNKQKHIFPKPPKIEHIDLQCIENVKPSNPKTEFQNPPKQNRREKQPPIVQQKNDERINLEQKEDAEHKLLKQNQKYKNVFLKQIAKYHDKLLKQTNHSDQKEKIAKEIHQKYTSKILNDYNSFQIPALMGRWLDSLKPEQYLQFYCRQAKSKFLQIGPIQPRIPLLLPTLSSENLNQERSYFSIFQFYEVFEQSSEISLHFDALNEFIDVKQIIRRTKEDLKKLERFTTLSGFVASDLNILGAQITLSDMQTFMCEYFYRNHRPLNESLTLKDPILPITLKSTQDGFYVFKFIEKEHEQKSHLLQVISKDKLLSVFYQKQSNYNGLRKNLPSKTKQISKLGEQIISETIQGAINHYSKDIEQMRVGILRNLVKSWFQDLKKIGFTTKKFVFQPQSSPFVEIPQYEVQPINLRGNEVFQSLLEQVSSLVDKEKIIEKVLSKNFQSKSQKIAFWVEYILEVKKEYQSVPALHFYATKKPSKFQQELKNRNFINFIFKYIKFDKLLQKFASLLGSYPDKTNHNELLNYGYDAMVDELNRIEIQLNMFSLTLSLKSKVWFHSFAIGYLIKFILSMNDLRNQIRKQTIEQVLSREKIILDQLIKGANIKEK